MGLYVLSDLHLSFSTNKPMDIFGVRWQNHYLKIKENWSRMVGEDDTVVIPGDISWGIDLEDAKEDLRFIHELPGRKIIGRGNHDYWWVTAAKFKKFIAENGFDTIDFLYNNAYLAGNIIVCGTRGWMAEFGVKEEDERIIAREILRLGISLDAAEKIKSENPHAEIVAFSHYPLMFGEFKNEGAAQLLCEHGVKRFYFGHLHGIPSSTVPSECCGVKQVLASGDALDFCPSRVD